MNIRIIYMGTPGFAVEALRRLLTSGHEVCAVVTAPDKPAGRGNKLHQSEIKQFVQDPKNGLSIDLLQPSNLKDPQFVETLRSYQADLFVVVAFRMLPEMVWNMPKYGTINIHASLLPQYRGAAPINWAIINGETLTGVTSFVLSHQIDTGELIDQLSTPIAPDETFGDLHDRLSILGAELLINTVDKLAQGNVQTIPQTETATLKPAPKLHKENTQINWHSSASQIHNLIRGLSPAPAAYTYITHPTKGELLVKVLRSHIEAIQPSEPEGTLLSDNKNFLKVACSDAYLCIDELQVQGKSRLAIKSFLAGFRNIEEWSLTVN